MPRNNEITLVPGDGWTSGSAPGSGLYVAPSTTYTKMVMILPRTFHGDARDTIMRYLIEYGLRGIVAPDTVYAMPNGDGEVKP